MTSRGHDQFFWQQRARRLTGSTAGILAPATSWHLFRHIVATAMLEGGPDIRYVEAMMGHDSSEEEREAISNGDDLLVRESLARQG